MNLNYKIEIQKEEEGNGYVVSCPELPGCITCADTISEGIELIEDAKKCWLSACLEDGVKIPEPDSIENNKIIISKTEKRKTIKDLFENFNGEYVPVNIDWGTPEGDEIW